MAELLYPKESYAIVGAAMEVYDVLGPGFLEAVYFEAMKMEMTARGIPFEAPKNLKIYYKGQALEKEYIADIFAYEKIIVELKSTKNLVEADKAQTINYLKATGCELGILFNFRHPEKLEMFRLIRTKKTKESFA